MASRKLTNTFVGHVHYAADILRAINEDTHPDLAQAAIVHSFRTVMESDTFEKSTRRSTVAAPPAAKEGASATEHPPTPPIRAYAHAAAVKAAATRKANKAKAAGNGNLAHATGTGENDAAGSDQTE